jgi:hypothetical protein
VKGRKESGRIPRRPESYIPPLLRIGNAAIAALGQPERRRRLVPTASAQHPPRPHRRSPRVGHRLRAVARRRRPPVPAPLPHIPHHIQQSISPKLIGAHRGRRVKPPDIVHRDEFKPRRTLRHIIRFRRIQPIPPVKPPPRERSHSASVGSR